MQIEDEVGLLWEDVLTADLSHFKVLLAAQRAAANLEKAKRGVDTAAADEVRRLEVKASRLAKLEVKRRKATEEARAIVTTKVEAQPRYAYDPDKELRAKLHTRCRICTRRHSPALCPFLFEDPRDSAMGYSRATGPDMELLFEKRFELDAGFREAITYLRSKFSRAPGSDEVIPRSRWNTQDAPLSAIRKWRPIRCSQDTCTRQVIVL